VEDKTQSEKKEQNECHENEKASSYDTKQNTSATPKK
jgi:hypothetical protein